MKSCNLVRTLSLSLRMRIRICLRSLVALSQTSVSLKNDAKIFSSKGSFSKRRDAISRRIGQSFTSLIDFLSRFAQRKDLPTFIISGIESTDPFCAFMSISDKSSTAKLGEIEYSNKTLSASDVSSSASCASDMVSNGTRDLAFTFPPCDWQNCDKRSKIFGYSSVFRLF